MSRALGRNYVVELASSGVIALAILAASAPFDLVVCDLNLGDVAGLDLYKAACARWPDLRERFLFMTGEHASGVPGLGDESSRMRVLMKPFDAATLHAIVHEVLERLPPRGAA